MRNDWCIKGSEEFAQYVLNAENAVRICGDDDTAYYSIGLDGF